MSISGQAREFVLKIVADVKDATKGMEDVEKSSNTMKDHLTGIGKVVGGALAVGAVVEFGKSSLQAAADAEQAMNGVRAVFGDSADEIEKFSSKAITSMGISDDAYQAFATTTGGLLKDMGVPLNDTITMTDELAQRGSDLASVYGVDADQAFTAMQKAMGGAYKGLKELGISLDANEVKAYAVSKGWTDASGNVTEAGKAMATQQLIMQKTADKAGAFASHSGEVANQQKILQLQFEETQETIGTKLLPVVSQLLEMIIPLVSWTAQYAGVLVPIAGVIAGIVVAMKAYEIVQGAVKVATAAWEAAQWLLNAAMSANPLGLIVIAIAAVVAAIVLLYTKVDWFRAGVDAAIDGIVAAWNWLLDTVKGVFNWVKDNWPLLLAIITGPFGLAALAISRNWDTIKGAATAAVEFIKQAVSTVWDIISYPFKQAADAVMAAWNPVKNFFTGLYQAINNAFNGLADVIKYPFKIAFDAIKNLWNSTVGGFGFEVPSWVPFAGGKSFKIPRMAMGGIVTSPTVALIGEAGPEAVVPLSHGGFGNTVINVYALTANAEVGRQVWEALREYERTSGRAVA